MTTPTRLFDFPYYQLANYPIADAFVTKYNGVWEKTSTQEFKAASGLSVLSTQMFFDVGFVFTNNEPPPTPGH